MKDNLPLNIDASNLKNGNWEGITKYGDIKYDKDKNALTFDGDGDYLKLTKPGKFSEGFTFEIYMNLERLGYNNGIYNGTPASSLFCKMTSLESDYYDAMRFGLKDDGELTVKFNETSSYKKEGKNFSYWGKDTLTSLGHKFISKQKDTYLTVVYQVYEENNEKNDETMNENGVDKVLFYIDGEPIGYGYYGHDSYIHGCSIWDNEDNPFFIGVCPWNKNNCLYYLQGDVYTVRLYNKSLSGEDVKANFDQTLLYREKVKEIN